MERLRVREREKEINLKREREVEREREKEMEVKRERVRKRKGQKKIEANILRKVKRCGALRKCLPAVGSLHREITISSNFLSFSFFKFIFLILYSFVVCCFVNQLGPSHGLLSPGGQENVEGGGGEGKGGA